MLSQSQLPGTLMVSPLLFTRSLSVVRCGAGDLARDQAQKPLSVSKKVVTLLLLGSQDLTLFLLGSLRSWAADVEAEVGVSRALSHY